MGEVKDESERVRSNYSGLFSRFRKNIREEDKESLIDFNRTFTHLIGI